MVGIEWRWGVAVVIFAENGGKRRRDQRQGRLGRGSTATLGRVARKMRCEKGLLVELYGGGEVQYEGLKEAGVLENRKSADQ